MDLLPVVSLATDDPQGLELTSVKKGRRWLPRRPWRDHKLCRMVLWPCIATLIPVALLLRGTEAVSARLGEHGTSVFGRKEGASAPLRLMHPLAQALGGGGGYAADVDDCDPMRKIEVANDIFCLDFMTFADAFGSRCSDWEGRDCSVAPPEYSENEMRAVRAHCKRACGLCGLIFDHDVLPECQVPTQFVSTRKQ